MFGARDVFGWRSLSGQALFALLPVAALLMVAQVLGPIAGLALALAPLAAIITLQQTFLIAIVFVSFSYFRLHEAIPQLAPLRIVGLSGAALVLGVLWAGLTVNTQRSRSMRDLRSLGVISVVIAVTAGVSTVALETRLDEPDGLTLSLLTVLGFCMAMICWSRLLEKSTEEGWPSFLKYYVAFFVVASLGVFASEHIELSFDHWVVTWWKVGLMVFATAWFCQTKGHMRIALYAVLLSGIVIACVAIYNKINGIGLVEGTRVTIGYNVFAPDGAILEPEDSAKYNSSLADPNELALVLLFALSFAAAIIVWRPSGLLTLLALIALPLIMLAIIYTQSRGGLLGVLALGGVIGLRVVKSKTILALAGAAAAIGLFVLMGIDERPTAASGDDAIDESALGRVYAWIAAMNMAVSNPFTGVGMASFVESHPDYAYHLTGYNKAAHSTWFEVLGQTGFPGLILFSIMLISAILAMRRANMRLIERQDDRGAIAISLGLYGGLVGFAVAGAFLTHGFTWPIYIQLALGAAVWRYVRRLELAEEAATRPPAPPRPARADAHWTRPSRVSAAGPVPAR